MKRRRVWIGVAALVVLQALLQTGHLADRLSRFGDSPV
jgi:hypothetical protein